MDTLGEALTATAGLFALMVLGTELGWRWGRREAAAAQGGSRVSAMHAAVSSLLGLLLAFDFGAAQTRLEARRREIAGEIAATSTAFMRLDLLPSADREAARDAVRRYLDARLAVYSRLSDEAYTQKALAEARARGTDVWRVVAPAVRGAKWPPTGFIILNPINAMLDAATARTISLNARTAPAVIVLLYLIAPVSALLAGYSTAERRKRSVSHMLLFALAVCATFYVILDFDSARFGLIRLENEQRLLEELRAWMR
jgi:hypothetical protein